MNRIIGKGDVNGKMRMDHTRKKGYKIVSKLHYDGRISQYLEDPSKFQCIYGPQRVRLSLRSSCEFLENFIENNLPKEAKVLDFGCGIGADSINFAKMGYRVVGIDISDVSIRMCKYFTEKDRLRADFFVMDGEALALPTSFFNLVFNNGSLSFVDLKRTLKEICRVLRSEGYFVGIDTLGHNPLLNLNRYLNYLRGLRTEKTIRGVIRNKDLELIRKHFHECHFFYFHLLTLLSIVLMERPWIVNLLEKLDRFLLKIPVFRRYAFKIVWICKQPSKELSFG
ncbi:MAG: class I SAM-dependent methyltransferase [Candidatus Hodarchaeota archaeon]